MPHTEDGSGHRIEDGAPSPVDALLAADAGAFRALCGEYAGVAGVGVAPAQAGVQGPGLDGVVAVAGAGDGELPQWSALAEFPTSMTPALCHRQESPDEL